VFVAARTEPVAPAGIGAYLIALALMLATTAAVLAGGWIGGAQATLLVAVVAVLEAVLLGRSGIRRLVALGLAIPLCAAVVVPTTIGLLPYSVSHLGFQHTVGEYIIQAFGGLLASGPDYFIQWAFMVGLSTVVWACGYWLGWVAFRERRGVLAVLPAIVVLAVNVLNAPSTTLTAGPGSSIGLAETAALLATLLVIGLAELSRLAFRWRSGRVPALEGLRGRYLTALSIASIGVVAAALVIPPVTSTDLSNLLFNGPGRGLGGSVAGAPNTVGFSSIVEPGGDLVNRPKPVLTYYTDSGSETYLQVVDDTVFNAGTWIPDYDTAIGQTIPAGAITRDPTALGASRSTSTVHIVFANSAGAATAQSGGSLGLFPGDPTSISLPGTVIGDVAPVVGTPTPTAPPPSGYECVGDNCPSSPLTTPTFLDVDEVSIRSGAIRTLQTSGSVSTATTAELENAGTDYPAWVKADAAPIVDKGASAQNVAQANAIASLAREWTLGTTNPYDAATAIEDHLRGVGFVYTLDPPKTPSGEWPIVYFLDSSHQGYCQYFASAMGAMLRSLGIPAMLVSGYGPGTATGRDTAAHQPIYQTTTTDGHSWVEAYFPGYGWIAFEPTPSSTFGAYVPFVRGGPTPTPSAAAVPSATPHPIRPTAPPVTASSAAASSGGHPPAWLLGFPAALVLAVLLALVALRWWRRPRSLAGVWRRLALAARMTGIRHDEAETRSAFAGRLSHALGGSGPPLLGTELGTVAELSGKAEFSPHGLADPDRRLWRDTWASIAPALTRLLRRRLLRRRAAI
jgi:hypothetical protein